MGLRFRLLLQRLKERRTARLFVSIVFVLTLIFVICRCVKLARRQKEMMADDSSKELMITAEDVEINKDVGVSAWLQGYLNYDFDACDQLVNPESYRFNNYVYEHGIEAHKKMYMLMQGKAVDAIDSIDVYNVVHDDTKNIYYVRVSCKKYKVPSRVSIDKDTYMDVCNDFVEGRLVAEEFEEELTKLYLSWLSDCFIINTDETVVFECQLIDYLDEDTGLLEVDDVSDFVTRVLSETRTLKVEQVYEAQLSKELDEVLEGY